ncbi:OLC1v1009871C1 [Oldenlandia corymbosa var. corymbosa]|uniref:OLC1v1009871C1 n=1 Tax=Oldenlandia corymbosa var. corymbosa TaxID=529605 RepID=A0AAV1DQ52_OLDCO|nr:OLC1v1009871C1 [Oldenlandia corymbosa var. corymbosa]
MAIQMAWQIRQLNNESAGPPPSTATGSRFPSGKRMTTMKGEEKEKDQLAESLNDLFVNVSTLVKGELQGTNNLLELLEKMNLRVAEEYKGFGDVASGLRVFMEQLKSKSGGFDEYVQQIDSIERQITDFEAVIIMLDKYVSLLESKVSSVYQTPPP